MPELLWKTDGKSLHWNNRDRIGMDGRGFGCGGVWKSVTNSIQPLSINILATLSTN
jgi:hypothetical protein